jgi:hypothetical protein
MLVAELPHDVRREFLQDAGSHIQGQLDAQLTAGAARKHSADPEGFTEPRA